jgi:hypothetical protein
MRSVCLAILTSSVSSLRRTLLGLVLGAVTTIAIAWCIVGVNSRAIYANTVGGYVRYDTSYLGIGTYKALGVSRFTWQHIDEATMARRVTAVQQLPTHSQLTIDQMVQRIPAPKWSSLHPQRADTAQFGDELAAGFPLLALRCGKGYRSDGSGWWTVDAPIGGMSAGLLARLGVVDRSLLAHGLPATPLWFGFIVNTLFYSLLWMVLMGVLFHARRVWRLHRGECAICGYDFRSGGLVCCPECGPR